MRSLSQSSDRGTVTAELAIGIPTVLGIVGLLLGALRWGMDGVSATTVAAETSFAIARGGDRESALGLAQAALPRAAWRIEQSATGVCTIATIEPPIPMIPAQQVRQCATA